jgi:tRNA threonylcarbamoyladenosine biosynthesis protein TsaB
LDAIAFGCGPGAFTGVRTACGVVLGLAFGLQLPVVPVVSLLSMAEAAKEINEWCDVLCCLDARMNEVYWAHYRFDGTAWIEIEAPRLSEFAIAISYAVELRIGLVLGQGLQLPEHLINLDHVYVMPHARFALRIARMKLRQGFHLDAEHAQPMYLRNKVALTTAERLLAREI